MNKASIAIDFGRKALDSADIDPDEKELISGFFKYAWLIDALAALALTHCGHLIKDEKYGRAIASMLDWANATDFFHEELSQEVRSRFMTIMVMTAAQILREQDAITRN